MCVVSFYGWKSVRKVVSMSWISWTRYGRFTSSWRLYENIPLYLFLIFESFSTPGNNKTNKFSCIFKDYNTSEVRDVVLSICCRTSILTWFYWGIKCFQESFTPLFSIVNDSSRCANQGSSVRCFSPLTPRFPFTMSIIQNKNCSHQFVTISFPSFFNACPTDWDGNLMN